VKLISNYILFGLSVFEISEIVYCDYILQTWQFAETAGILLLKKFMRFL
jgi:hypothetical protein